jgi:hypothetical protein
VLVQEPLRSYTNNDARFRWAVCQLDALGKCVNRKMLQEALAGLPPNLDQTYNRILAAIDEDYSQYALRILQWLTFSTRPLLIDEVAEVVAIDAKRDPAFDRGEVLEDPLEVLNICSSLVTMTVDDNYRVGESSRQIVALAHYSVKEYLVSDRIWTGKAARYGMRDDICHDALATSCLKRPSLLVKKPPSAKENRCFDILITNVNLQVQLPNRVGVSTIVFSQPSRLQGSTTYNSAAFLLFTQVR